MEKLEKDIEKSLVQMVRQHGGLCLKWVCPSWVGVPDRIILLPGGRVMFVELKRSKTSSVSAMQVWWARKLKDLGFVHRWVKCPEDVAALESVIVAQLRPQKYDGYSAQFVVLDELEDRK